MQCFSKNLAQICRESFEFFQLWKSLQLSLLVWDWKWKVAKMFIEKLVRTKTMTGRVLSDPHWLFFTFQRNWWTFGHSTVALLAMLLARPPLKVDKLSNCGSMWNSNWWPSTQTHWKNGLSVKIRYGNKQRELIQLININSKNNNGQMCLSHKNSSFSG